ncbi:hypothetical protein [Alteromonas confluentis]|uniref:hypothetical protein n=1 Tax=Alteromonas confluentis TaxID=1656094 RepID=UPI0014815161|nr:hypothetical protein [Alteromonas confluentis]
MTRFAKVVSAVLVVATASVIAKGFNDDNQQTTTLKVCGNDDIARVDAKGFACQHTAE